MHDNAHSWGGVSMYRSAKCDRILLLCLSDLECIPERLQTCSAHGIIYDRIISTQLVYESVRSTLRSPPRLLLIRSKLDS